MILNNMSKKKQIPLYVKILAGMLLGVIIGIVGVLLGLKNIYSISRGYEDLAQRLNKLGAKIEILQEF